MLEVEKIDIYYGDIQALFGISLYIGQNEIVTLIGTNASGKTTTLNAISGFMKAPKGSIEFDGQRIDRLSPYDIVKLGVTQVPEGRQLFPYMTVLENLELGAYTAKARGQKNLTMQEVFKLFPSLTERRFQLSGSLSGGEQQMLAIGRGLMSRPKLLMLDEPSLGLAPILVLKIFEIIKEIREKGTTILLVEQNVRHSLNIADRGYVIVNGKIIYEGKAQEILNEKDLKKAFLGL